MKRQVLRSFLVSLFFFVPPSGLRLSPIAASEPFFTLQHRNPSERKINVPNQICDETKLTQNPFPIPSGQVAGPNC